MKKEKTRKSNLYFFVVSLAFVMWFRGINGLLGNLTFGADNIYINVLWALGALVIYYLDDSNISELTGNYNIPNIAAGAVIAQ